MYVMTQEGKNSANHDLFNPFAVNAIDAPIREHPATFLYCCPVAILEWNIGQDIVLPPVAILESLVFHRSHPPQDIERYLGHYPFSSDVDIGQTRHPALPDR